jgi:hypothetical protein
MDVVRELRRKQDDLKGDRQLLVERLAEVDKIPFLAAGFRGQRTVRQLGNRGFWEATAILPSFIS